MNKRVLFAWSGGKDSAMALHEVQKTGNYEISALLTTVTRDYDRISMLGVRRELLEQQAVANRFDDIILPKHIDTVKK